MTNPEQGTGRTAQNPEATEVSDEEYLEADWASVVGSISPGNAKYTEILPDRMPDGCRIATLILLNK